MAASMSVVVLCPNGRRQTLKVSPNTSLLQVLEEASKKQGFEAQEYELKHRNKRLDLSLSVRFSNLPNNGLIEMCPASKLRTDGVVTLGLQTETGERLLHDFQSSKSLWDIISYWIKERGENVIQSGSSDGEPICLYIRKEVAGEVALKNTTLHSLGLTSGKAIIRLMYRPVESLKNQAHVTKPLSHLHVQDFKPDQPESDKCLSTNVETISETSLMADPLNQDLPRFVVPTQEDPLNQDCPRLTVPTQEDSLNSFVEVQEQPDAVSSEEVRIDAEDVPDRMQDNQRATGNSQCVEEVDKNCQPIDSMETESELVYIGQREALLFNIQDMTPISKDDLPDEFYEVTLDDVRYLLKDLKKQRQQLEERQLETKSMREAQQMDRALRYKQTVIRIQFPDRLVLQCRFPSVEKVVTVIEFLKEFLEDKNLEFYLYTTPPKVILDPEARLFEANLVPAAVVYFGCSHAVQSYLHPDVKAKVSSPAAARLAASKYRKATRGPLLGEEDDSSYTSSQATPHVAIVQDERRVVPPHFHSSGHLPKWLKLGNK
ncbi:tether containing UBX domain for GLUT4 [Tachypleus tridentatus]|uniref:tether containing UBX domain for GLUT4 n=1 Tax=Tachypleus tridentatus TaxID=6853 RepID=UPI003FD591EE